MHQNNHHLGLKTIKSGAKNYTIVFQYIVMLMKTQ